MRGKQTQRGKGAAGFEKRAGVEDMANIGAQMKRRIHDDGIEQAGFGRGEGEEIALQDGDAGPVLDEQLAGARGGEFDRDGFARVERGEGVEDPTEAGGRLEDAGAGRKMEGRDQASGEGRGSLEKLKRGDGAGGGAVFVAVGQAVEARAQRGQRGAGKDRINVQIAEAIEGGIVGVHEEKGGHRQTPPRRTGGGVKGGSGTG